MGESPHLLRLHGITVRFPGVTALDKVDFDLRPGEVHALMGQNGAGKSTLVRCVTGAQRPSAGRMILRGRPFAPGSPADAPVRGIRAIYQELDLAPNLSATENILLGRLPRRWGGIAWRAARAEARSILERFGVEIDVAAPIGSFPPAVQQLVAIARAMSVPCDALIMDEPTSSLDAAETDRLFELVGQLRDQGLAILFITHFLDEVYRVADRITVLRNGVRVTTCPVENLPRRELVASMLGRSVPPPRSRRQDAPRGDGHETADRAAPILRARGIGRRRVLEPVDIDLHEGVVTGLAGLLGSGRTELVRLLFGLDRATSGHVEIDGARVRIRGPRSLIARGMGCCPEDRRTEGVIPELSVEENILLAAPGRITRFGVISRRRRRRIATQLIRALSISTTGPGQPVGELSGGNQQKVVLARWLARRPRLLILDEPTRGIDVGARVEIEELVDGLARDGVAVLLISSELEEVVRHCDRVLVLRDRAAAGMLHGEEIDLAAIFDRIASAPRETGDA